MFTTHLCKKLIPFPVTFSGNPGENGMKRKLGLIYTTDPGRPDLAALKDYVIREVQRCGGRFAATATFPRPNVADGTSPDYAAPAMASFKQQGITTVVWAGGYETYFSHAANKLAYSPEWVLAGDGKLESINGGELQDQAEWAHAWVIANVTWKKSATNQQPCYTAYKEADPAAEDGLVGTYACPMYNDWRQLFTAIQVAGPRLTPHTIDQGFHAIPAVSSTDATVPACYYDADDYTCVKDAISMWWDSTATCWRATEQGKRYVAGSWPDGDITAQRDPSRDGCNQYGANLQG
jgi:hypothetical protein